MAQKCVIEANPDVTGTGIRASIYALCLASGIFKAIVRHSTSSASAADFSRSINAALQLQGLALLCTAIYQSFRKQLTLFHAICVLHLLSLLGFGLVSKGRYGKKGRIRKLTLWLFKSVVAGAFLAFAGYIWVTAPTFGSQPACNATTIYVVFGVKINATEPVLRYLLLALTCSLVLGMVFGMLVFGTILACICGTHRKDQILQTEDMVMMKDILSRIKIKNNKASWAMLQSEVSSVLLTTGVNVYAIVTLEQTIRSNNVGDGERVWGFGQVLALFLLLGPVAELVNIFLAKVDMKQRKEDLEVAESGPVIAVQGNSQHLLTNGEDGIELQSHVSSSRR